MPALFVQPRAPALFAQPRVPALFVQLRAPAPLGRRYPLPCQLLQSSPLLAALRSLRAALRSLRLALRQVQEGTLSRRSLLLGQLLQS